MDCFLCFISQRNYSAGFVGVFIDFVERWISDPPKPEDLLLRLQEGANIGFRELLLFLLRHVFRVMLTLFRVVETEFFVEMDFESGKDICHL
jgi:hypothetical protein